MTVVRTVSELRALIGSSRARRHTVGFVPTMGALHDGHLELARRAAAGNDLVVLSIFVNPTQFNDHADLAGYPRTEAADVDAASAAGVDLVFAPSAGEVYPPAFRATVMLTGPIVDGFEGANRGPAHFHGVTTVVTKLLNMVGPNRAYFGQKDAQQLRVVRALVSDLNLPVEIVGVPTVRDADGLALSSRNALLDSADRATALGLSRALAVGRRSFDHGERSAEAIVAAAAAVLTSFGVTPEYLAVVDADTFVSLAHLESTGALLIVAAPVGSVRLIDNFALGAPRPAGPSPAPDRKYLTT